jgi:hypothetical protein
MLGKLAVVATLLVAAIVGSGLAIGGGDFLRQHWGALTFAAVTVAGMVWFTAKLVAAAARGAILAVRRPKALGESGAVMAEFVIVCIPFFLMFFGLMQMALASLARVLVSYAAFAAARAAIVVIPMAGPDASSVGGAVSSTANNEQANKIGYGANTRTDFAISNKAALIRNAAAYAMIPASPSIDTVVSDTMNNWGNYFAGRLLHGLDPSKYLGSLVSDLAGVPSAMLDTLADQLKTVVGNGLNSDQARADAKNSIDSFIDGMTSDPTMRDKLKQAANGYIDKAQGDASGAAGDWVSQQIDGTLSGPLDKFKSQVQNAVGGALGSATGGLGGGGSQGMSVDRALDTGFGGGTDGAGGAILRSLRKLVYARMGTIVTLLDESGNFKSSFAWNDPIRVRVTHLYYCQIPLANRFAGRAFYSLSDTTVADMATGPMKGLTIIGIPGYFLPITAEHTLVNQGKP